MSLLSRLKPEYYQALEEEKKVYPVTVDIISTELDNLNFYVDLKYSTICFLVYTFKLRTYDPLTIQKLFLDENSEH